MEFTTLSSLPVFHPDQYYIGEVSEGQGKVQSMAKLGRHLTKRMNGTCLCLRLLNFSDLNQFLLPSLFLGHRIASSSQVLCLTVNIKHAVLSESE